MNWVLRVNYKVTQGSDMPRAPWSSLPLTTKMMVAKIVMIITTILKYYKDGADDCIDDDCDPT